MAKIEVKQVQSAMTKDDLEPHWEAVVDYGGFAVNIPLPARYLITDDAETQRRQSVEAMESLAEALLRFANQTRKRWKAVIVFWDRISADQWRAAQSAAPGLGLRLVGIEFREQPYDYERALAQLPSEDHRALIVLTSPVFAVPDRARLPDFALRHRLASMFSLREFVNVGGFMSYGASFTVMFRRAAEYVDRIARGAKPTDLPIEQPTKFELVINLRTAKALGIEIPPTLLARADEVIE